VPGRPGVQAAPRSRVIQARLWFIEGSPMLVSGEH
jgi:hypothetical protein